MSNPFSGNTQHATMWNVGQIDEEERLRNDLEKLEEKRKSLLDRLYVEGAEDQQVGRELDAVVKEIDALTQQMKIRVSWVVVERNEPTDAQRAAVQRAVPRRAVDPNIDHSHIDPYQHEQ